jgi:hypothetical protein
MYINLGIAKYKLDKTTFRGWDLETLPDLQLAYDKEYGLVPINYMKCIIKCEIDQKLILNQSKIILN